MLWWGEPNTIYVLRDDGRYGSFYDTWEEGMANTPCDAKQPTGLWLPIRGFGKVWCEEAAIQDALGYALHPEEGGAALMQRYDAGMLVSRPDGGYWALLAGDRWSIVSP